MGDVQHKRVKLCIAIISVVALVMMVRVFCVSSHRLYTHSMENTLSKGDFVLVFKRWMLDAPSVGDVMLFKSPLYKDLLSAPIFLSRCVALPGDTFRVEDESHYLNNRMVLPSSQRMRTYTYPVKERAVLKKAMDELKIPYRANKKNDSLLSLTHAEYCTLSCMMAADTLLSLSDTTQLTYQVVVPQKGKTYVIDSISSFFYKEAILVETQGKARFEDGKLYLKGKELTHYRFEQDYFWFLSDNSEESVDSRHVGIVPEKQLTGRVFFCWYSADKAHRFKRVN